ncbi:MAG TPA: hypothetical protein VFG69_06645 [Nannocystaceae bacterium]|nr:hypothetical protein [Nannocystaceae bacterium]
MGERLGHRITANTPQLVRLGWILGALVLGLESSRASASPLSELAASLEPGEWGELATEEIDAVLSASGASGIQIPYAEDIVWDPQTQQLHFLGGDHADIADHISYSADTNTWQTLERPSWIGEGTMHGYDHSAIDVGRRFVYHRPFANNVVHRYDIDSDTWTMLPSPPDEGTSCCDALEFFPDMDGILWAHHSYFELWLFAESTQEWTLVDDSLPAGTTWEVAEYNPVHRLVLFTSAETMYQLANDGAVTEIGPLGAPIYDGTGYNGVLTVDPVSGDFLVSTPAGEGDRTFHVYGVIENAWAELPTQPDLDLTSTGMVATPIADHGVTLFVYCHGGTPCGVLAYKHAPFDAPPDPGTSSGADDSDADGTQGGDAGTSAGIDDTAGDDGTPPAEDTSAPPTSADDSGTGDDAAADDDDASGCACHQGPRPPGRDALLPGLVVLAGAAASAGRSRRAPSSPDSDTSRLPRGAASPSRSSLSRSLRP